MLGAIVFVIAMALISGDRRPTAPEPTPANHGSWGREITEACARQAGIDPHSRQQLSAADVAFITGCVEAAKAQKGSHPR